MITYGICSRDWQCQISSNISTYVIYCYNHVRQVISHDNRKTTGTPRSALCRLARIIVKVLSCGSWGTVYPVGPSRKPVILWSSRASAITHGFYSDRQWQPKCERDKHELHHDKSVHLFAWGTVVVTILRVAQNFRQHHPWALTWPGILDLQGKYNQCRALLSRVQQLQQKISTITLW